MTDEKGTRLERKDWTGEPDKHGWLAIEGARDNETVLTQHKEDLFPVPAYRLTDADGTQVWLRETEGPEDSFYGGSRHEPLYRTPTHYRPLPPPPAS